LALPLPRPKYPSPDEYERPPHLLQQVDGKKLSNASTLPYS
jgi:hypothetical protein